MYLPDQLSVIMKTVNFRIILAGIFCFMALSLSAQDDTPTTETPEQGPQSLMEQFLHVKKESNTYKSNTGRKYKVVQESMLDDFWTNIKDSVATFQQQLDATQAKVDEQNTEIKDVNQTLVAKDKTIQESDHASTHIGVLGIDLMKDSFVTFFFAAIIILGLMLGLAIYRFKRSNQVTAKTRHDYRSLQHELEEFRKKALERERKLRRELQTERNTVEELRTSSGQKDKTRFY